MNKRIILAIAIILIIGSIIWLQSLKPEIPATAVPAQSIVAPTPSLQPVTAPTIEPTAKEEAQYLTAAQKNKEYKPGIELAGITNYHNLPVGQSAVTLKSLVGKKVILVDFWTYSCINCQRTLPYLTDWYKKYKDQGLEIIGVHTPEFEFEKDPANVQMAITKYGITYPVVQDNNYGTWNAYSNLYWPRHYLIDIDGYIVQDHVGEGGYAQTEQKIQELLTERASRLKVTVAAAMPLSHPSVEAAPTYTVSPETYFGAARNQYFGNGIPGETGSRSFVLPSDFSKNMLYLGGAWKVVNEYAINESLQAKIVYPYTSRNVYIVAKATEGTAFSRNSVVVEVLRDGKPLTAQQAGEDVQIGADGKSTVTIKEARLYKLIKEAASEGHTLELIIQGLGLEVFTFTFG